MGSSSVICWMVFHMMTHAPLTWSSEINCHFNGQVICSHRQISLARNVEKHHRFSCQSPCPNFWLSKYTVLVSIFLVRQPKIIADHPGYHLGGPLGDPGFFMEHRLQLHLHSQLTIWHQGIRQRQPQDSTRIFKCRDLVRLILETWQYLFDPSPACTTLFWFLLTQETEVNLK